MGRIRRWARAALAGAKATRAEPSEWTAGPPTRQVPVADSKAGYVDGVHFTEHVERITDLKRAQRNGDAIALLLKCVAATEAEDRLDRGGVAPWYYGQLAILYRKEKRFADEVAILERYAQQRKAPGSMPPKLADRLVKARVLLSKSQSR